ncbi:linker for activation of T-cells family member 1 isoform X2 [Megalobrama amblycephala]|uniref:linker for activation of T-cells family member 1 isoform X2 n=1 Tax=Megalobrama amblycephala TaxID=75352 RepID=UPI002013FAFF|nr:linker for activation of T-cells family member 1 isoform X2 [Megalobrama amblycephala]
MDSTTLLSVVSGAVLLSIILVTSLCTYCWRHKQPTSIPQRSSDSSPEYNSTFVVRHPQSTYAPHPDPHRIINVPYPLPNSLSSPSITVTKVPSCPPSETGSQASYVNYDNEDEQDIQLPGDYITVIPDPPHSPGKQPSSQSSDNTNNYINELSGSEDDSISDSHDYENFKNSSDLQNQPACLSRGSMSSDDDQGSSEYVNTA